MTVSITDKYQITIIHFPSIRAVCLCKIADSCRFHIFLYNQEAATSALDKMAAVFESESHETSSDSLETAAVGMCGTIGNLLDVASENAAVHQPNSTNQTSSENVKEQADNETMHSKVGLRVFHLTYISVNG